VFTTLGLLGSAHSSVPGSASFASNRPRALTRNARIAELGHLKPHNITHSVKYTHVEEKTGKKERERHSISIYICLSLSSITLQRNPKPLSVPKTPIAWTSSTAQRSPRLGHCYNAGSSRQSHIITSTGDTSALGTATTRAPPGPGHRHNAGSSRPWAQPQRGPGHAAAQPGSSRHRAAGIKSAKVIPALGVATTPSPLGDDVLSRWAGIP
jgi:hypothetical protein